jgi:hypothetical protein
MVEVILNHKDGLESPALVSLRLADLLKL